MAVSDADCHLTFLQWDSASRNVGKNIFRFMKPQSARLAAPASGASGNPERHRRLELLGAAQKADVAQNVVAQIRQIEARTILRSQEAMLELAPHAKRIRICRAHVSLLGGRI